MAEKTHYSPSYFRLVALWALAETGLGGVMHALHIPFTGLFVGGFAVVTIALIGKQTQSAKALLTATLYVVLLKGVISPQSPPMAYVAVLFQGISGALLYGVFPTFFGVVIHPLLSMIESALQRVFMVTLFFGMAFWKALDDLSQRLAMQLGWEWTESTSVWIIAGWITLHAVWGLLLSFMIWKMASSVDHVKPLYKKALSQTITAKAVPKKTKKKKPLYLGLLLFFLTASLLLTYLDSWKLSQLVTVMLRSFLVVGLWFLIVIPIVKWGIQKWVSKRQAKDQNTLSLLMSELNLISQRVPAFWKVSNKNPFTLLLLLLYDAQNGEST